MTKDAPGPSPLSDTLSHHLLTQLSLEEPVPTLSTTTASPTTPADAPKNPRARKDPHPFQFGTRLLTDPEAVFSHNAWDHVETDASYQASAAASIALQRSRPVDAFNKRRFNSNPAKWWDAFYKNNTTNFFKDRKWLQQEFPLLDQVTLPDAGEVRIVELGCGVGNTLFPILRLNRNPTFCIHGCDFSKKAVELVKAEKLFVEEAEKGTVVASVYDLAEEGALPEGIQEGTVDAVIMVFVFSALSPDQWTAALANVRTMLKKGGKVLFRDYGRGDLTQVRFKAGRYLEENFYVRGDGTRVYFFDEDELRRIFTGETAEKKTDGEAEDCEEGSPSSSTPPATGFGGFKINALGVDRRLLVNRKTQVKMYRCWMQAVFEKV